MSIDVLADIGGTNARVAFRQNGASWRKVYLRQTANFPSLETLLADVIAINASVDIVMGEVDR